MRKTLVAAAAALALQASPQAAQAGHYTVVDVNADGRTAIYAMNAKGQAVGAADEYAFLREKDGSIVFFSVPDNNDAVPMAIDRGGDIAGFAFHGCGAIACATGFVRKADGAVRTFYASGNPLDNTQVRAMNDARETVGYFLDPSYATHSFMRQADGTVTVVDGPGSQDTQLVAVNNNGVAAGTFSDGTTEHGLLVAPDGSQTVFDMPGAQSFVVTGMNDAGSVVGYYDDSTGEVGFIRSPDGTITPIVVDGSSNTRAVSINRSGSIAGSYALARRGFVQTPAGDIASLKIKGAAYIAPDCINDRGAVAGTYQVKLGRGFYLSYGFIWQP